MRLLLVSQRPGCSHLENRHHAYLSGVLDRSGYGRRCPAANRRRPNLALLSDRRLESRRRDLPDRVSPLRQRSLVGRSVDRWPGACEASAVPAHICQLRRRDGRRPQGRRISRRQLLTARSAVVSGWALAGDRRAPGPTPLLVVPTLSTLSECVRVTVSRTCCSAVPKALLLRTAEPVEGQAGRGWGGGDHGVVVDAADER